MLSPREIKAKRILLGLRVKDLAAEATESLERKISESQVSQVLARRMSGEHDLQVQELQKFLAKKLKIPVRELKPPFEVAGWPTK